MSQTLSVSDAIMGKFTLSITTRSCGDSPQVMEDLTYKTIKAWLWIANLLEHGEYTLPVDDKTGELMGSVEDRYTVATWETNEEFKLADAWGDSRVTVWDTFKSQSRIGFHLNSDDIPQIAVDTWLANHKAIERVLADTPQTAVKPHVDAPNSSATPSQGSNAPATPKSQNSAPAGTFYSKKDAIAKLNASDSFKMKIVQIKKRSTDGKDFYEFYEPYGGKPGDFSAVSVFTDNEIAINNGLIAYLDTLGIKLGQALTGNWILNCSVGKPKTKTVKGEEKTFTNIYVNSFEGQPEHA